MSRKQKALICIDFEAKSFDALAYIQTKLAILADEMAEEILRQDNTKITQVQSNILDRRVKRTGPIESMVFRGGRGPNKKTKSQLKVEGSELVGEGLIYDV